VPRIQQRLGRGISLVPARSARGRATAERTRKRALRRDLVASRRSGRSYDELDALALVDLDDDFLWLVWWPAFLVVLEADVDADADEEEVSAP
jgi:hypothetical protein